MDLINDKQFSTVNMELLCKPNQCSCRKVNSISRAIKNTSVTRLIILLDMLLNKCRFSDPFRSHNTYNLSIPMNLIHFFANDLH